jgi:NitT/TauT family transport system substrate-binding protein
MQSLSRRSLIAGVAAAAAGAASRGPAAAQTSNVLRVGAGKIEPQSEAYYALDGGFFKKFGLDVDVQTLLNAGVTSSAVAGGDLQIGTQTTLGIAQARQRGVPFVIIASGARNDAHFSAGQLVVAPQSPIVSAKDLSGKAVGIETLNGLASLTIKATVDQAGGDSSTVKFLEIPAGLMPDAIQQGRIAGALLQDPVLTQTGNRVRALGDPNSAIGGQFVSIGWFTTLDWLAKNKEPARNFAKAIYAAGEWAMANPQLASASLNKHLGISGSAARQRFATQMNIADYRHLFDVAVKYKYIAPMNPEEIVWDGK